MFRKCFECENAVVEKALEWPRNWIWGCIDSGCFTSNKLKDYKKANPEKQFELYKLRLQGVPIHDV